MSKLEIQKPIKCRGRNGFFRLASLYVDIEMDEVCINIYSKTYGRFAPISFQGTRTDLYNLLLLVNEILERPTASYDEILEVNVNERIMASRPGT